MKRYQAIAFLLSTAMTVGSVAPVFGASNDVFGHWAEFTITKWQNEGRIGGYEDGTFKPDKSITRAEFVRLLNSAVPTAFTSSASVSFSDVKESDWFFADVAKAVGSGVTSGFEDGTFRPGETVTRMQAAVFIAKAKGLTPNEAAANNFTDAAQIPAWAKGSVGAAVSAGYLSGYPDGSFGGSKGMTRAEAVSTLDRVLGGTSSSNQGTSQGEIDTTDRDSQTEKEETTTTANAGDMVWSSGGSGSRKSSSSSGGGSSSSSSSNTISRAVEISSQKDADELEGKTLTGKATIYAKEGMTFKDVRFKGDVDIVADDSTVASAYIGKDVAVAAGYSGSIKIYFEGRTNVNGMLRTIKGGKPDTQVIIVAKTPRTISALIKALIPTKIVGIEVAKVEASAPVEVADNAKVNTIIAETGASVKAEGEVNNVNVTGDVKNIELSGSGSTTVKVNDKASVEKIDVKDNTEANVKVNGSGEVGTVAVSDSASAKVAVNDTATVGKVEISDTATANVAVDEEAKVETVTSTSTAPGSTVTGTGTVDKIESENPGTLEKDDEVQASPIETPDKPDDSGSTDGEQNPGGDTAKPVDAEALKKLKITVPETVVADTTKVDIKGDGVTATGTWEADAAGENKYTASVTLKATNGFAEGLTVKDITEALEAAFGTDVDVSNVAIADGKITFTVTATITGEVDPPVGEEPAITGITAGLEATGSGAGAAVSSNIVTLPTDGNVVVKLTATTEKITGTDAKITWTADNNLTPNPAESTVASNKAETTLTIPHDFNVGTNGTKVKVTAKYTYKDAQDADKTVTKEIDLTVQTKAQSEAQIGSVAIDSVEDVNFTAQTTNAEQTITATIKNGAGTDWAAPAGTTAPAKVTWKLTGATSANTGFKAVDAAADTQVTPETIQTATETADNKTTTQVKLVVGEDEVGPLTLVATCEGQTGESESKQITVTPKAKATLDTENPPTKVEFGKDDAAAATGTTTIKFKDAELVGDFDEKATTDYVNFVVKKGGATDTENKNFGLTFAAAKGTNTDVNNIVVTVTKGSATEGTYTVEATVAKEAFTTATAPTADIKATFDVEVAGDTVTTSDVIVAPNDTGKDYLTVETDTITVKSTAAADKKKVNSLIAGLTVQVKGADGKYIGATDGDYFMFVDIAESTSGAGDGATNQGKDSTEELVSGRTTLKVYAKDDVKANGTAPNDNAEPKAEYNVTVESNEVTVKPKNDTVKYTINPSTTNAEGTVTAGSIAANGTAITTAMSVKDFVDKLEITKPTDAVVKVSVNDTEEAVDANTKLVESTEADKKVVLIVYAKDGATKLAEYVVVVTMPAAEVDEAAPADEVTFATENDNSDHTTTIKLKNATLASTITENSALDDTQISFKAIPASRAAEAPSQDNNFGLKFTAKAKKSSVDTNAVVDSIEVTVEKDKAKTDGSTTTTPEGKYTVTATIQEAAFDKDKTTFADDNKTLTATFDVVVQPATGKETEIETIVLTGLDDIEKKMVVDGKTDEIKIGANSDKIAANPEVKWYATDATTTEVTQFASGKTYKATVTMTTATGKSFASGFANDASKILGVDTKVGEVSNVKIDSTNTPNKVTFDIIFTKTVEAAPAADPGSGANLMLAKETPEDESNGDEKESPAGTSDEGKNEDGNENGNENPEADPASGEKTEE